MEACSWWIALCATVCASAAGLGAPPWKIFKSLSEFYRSGPGRLSALDCAGSVAREYDFIVVGGGTAGAAAAGRLSEVPGWTVLVLEAGGLENRATEIPLMASYVLNTGYNWGYSAEPDPGFCRAMEDHRCRWSSGRALGGSTVINYMLYTRGHRGDYDAWERLGNPGWGYSDVLPLFLKSEQINIPDLLNSSYHSKYGEVLVERSPFRTPLAPLFLKAGQALGYKVNDPNGESQEGFSYVQATIKDGSRFSAWQAYLRPSCKRANLVLADSARVTKILVHPTTKKVFGVEYVKDRRAHIVRVRKEVILSAGTLNSPQLLMLSGLGPREHLEELGIPVIQDLPVGDNLQDHVTLSGLTFLVNESVTLLEKRILSQPKYAVDYLVHRNGPLTIPGGAEALAFVRTKFAKEGVPDVELVFGPGAYSSDRVGSLRKAFAIRDDFYKKLFGPIQDREAFSIVPVLLRPHSQGYIRLRSKNPFHWPLIYPNYLSDERDMKVLVEGVKMAVAVGESAAFQRYNSTLYRAPCPGCESFEHGTDEYWACAIRQLTTSLHHQVGTCRMGPPEDPATVVDARLRVLGVQGLRVADCSIIPLIPASHTMAPAYMIGEKVAKLIKQEWGKREGVQDHQTGVGEVTPCILATWQERRCPRSSNRSGGSDSLYPGYMTGEKVSKIIKQEWGK
uniref:Glucose-methanol-choline oxidoreductase N-terminal domain-containing protein n=1 Tax=Timema bartmani TaxID=61472 RepID=A0A7R9I6T7_9NEOP|nr:unnamed protein product [Timema bartmani]